MTPNDPSMTLRLVERAQLGDRAAGRVAAALWGMTAYFNGIGHTRLPLLVTLVAQAVIVAMLAGGINNTNVVISMFAFNFCWIFVDIYQAATIANVDHSGRYLALIPAAQGFGNFLGPNIAATVLAFGFGYDGIFMMCAAASITAMLVYLYMYLMLRKKIPALADAS